MNPAKYPAKVAASESEPAKPRSLERHGSTSSFNPNQRNKMFGSAYRKNKVKCHDVGSLIEYLKQYPENTPIESTFGNGVLALKHENCEDPAEISICIESLDDDDDE